MTKVVGIAGNLSKLAFLATVKYTGEDSQDVCRFLIFADSGVEAYAAAEKQSQTWDVTRITIEPAEEVAEGIYCL